MANKFSGIKIIIVGKMICIEPHRPPLQCCHIHVIPDMSYPQLISDVGVLVPSVEEAGLLSAHTRVYVAQFVFESPDDIKIKGQPWIGGRIKLLTILINIRNVNVFHFNLYISRMKNIILLKLS